MGLPVSCEPHKQEANISVLFSTIITVIYSFNHLLLFKFKVKLMYINEQMKKGKKNLLGHLLYLDVP